MTGQAVSDLLNVSPRWLAKLEEQGFAKRLENKQFDVIDVCLGYIRWLKDDARLNNKTAGAKRKEDAQALKVEIEIAEKLGRLVDMETVELAFLEMFTAVRTEIGAVPAGVTRDLQIRAEIETLLNGAFDRCQAAFEALRQALRSNCPDLDALEEGEP